MWDFLHGCRTVDTYVPQLCVSFSDRVHVIAFFSSSGERPFKCAICNKAFNQKGALQIHMSGHTGDKPHSCDFCPATFSQKGNLRAHIQVGRLPL